MQTAQGTGVRPAALAQRAVMGGPSAQAAGPLALRPVACGTPASVPYPVKSECRGEHPHHTHDEGAIRALPTACEHVGAHPWYAQWHAGQGGRSAWVITASPRADAQVWHRMRLSAACRCAV